MPRDKTDTHRRLLPCIRQEFLKYGYQKASLKNIARNAGITTAGLYRHFPIKEAMFAATVEPVTEEFLKSCDASMEETSQKFSDSDFWEHFNEFRTEKTGKSFPICTTIMMYSVCCWSVLRAPAMRTSKKE